MCKGFPPLPRGGGSSASSHPSVHLSTLISSVLHLVHPPGPDAWGKRSRARRPEPCSLTTSTPPAATPGECGKNRRAARSGGGRGRGRRGTGRIPLLHFPFQGEGHHAPTQHTARRWTPKPGPARRDPPPTRRGEAQAALGKRAALGPHRGGQRTPRARAALAHTLWQVAPAATALQTSGGAAAGGSRYPKAPLSDR